MRQRRGAHSCQTIPAVDFVVNVFERTYRGLTEPQAFARLARAQRFPFARRVLLVNNVLDQEDARMRVERLLREGEIDEAHFVADHLERALAICGLTRSELQPVQHYCDAPLVAITLPGSPWLLYWDAEATLDTEADWVTPACAKLMSNQRLLVANPSWEQPGADGRRPGVDRETRTVSGDFALGHGFSDQAFLVLRANVAAPIYRTRCIGKIVHPRAHKGTTFEPRINAYMRHNGLLRATYLPASFSIDQPEDRRACRPRGAREWARYARNALILRASAHSPWRPRCLRHTWIGADLERSQPWRGASLERSRLWNQRAHVAAHRLRRYPRIRSTGHALQRRAERLVAARTARTP